ncbi:hypothetical protein ACV1CV_12530 [Aeromonas veronii]
MPSLLFRFGRFIVADLVTSLFTTDSSPSDDDPDCEPSQPNPAHRRQAELLLAQLCRELKIHNPGLDTLILDPKQCYRDILETLEREAQHNAAIEQRKLDALTRQREALATFSLPTQGADHA